VDQFPLDFKGSIQAVGREHERAVPCLHWRAGLKGLPTLFEIVKQVMVVYHDVSCFRSFGSFTKFRSSSCRSKILQVDPYRNVGSILCRRIDCIPVRRANSLTHVHCSTTWCSTSEHSLLAKKVKSSHERRRLSSSSISNHQSFLRGRMCSCRLPPRSSTCSTDTKPPNSRQTKWPASR
jgi:hypothetical protein